MEWIVGIGIGLVLLFLFPRKMLALAGVLVFLGLCVAGYFYVADQYERQYRSKVSAFASGDPKYCPAANLVLVVIRNDSGTTTNSVGFHLRARRPGFSNEVYSSYLSTDKIIETGSAYSACWSLSKSSWHGLAEIYPIQQLQWEAEVTSVYWAK